MGEYDTVIGTGLVGIFFNTFLYGFVTYQFAVYYRTKFNDRPTTKYMVLFLFLLDTLHSIVSIYSAWYYTVANYDNPAVLALNEWTYAFTPIGTALAAFVTQIYLGFRIWSLTSSKVLYGVVIVLATSSLVLAVTCGIEVATINYLSDLVRATPLVIAWMFTQVVADTFITVTLIIVFYRWRGGFRKTDTILNRLMRGAIQTGLFAVIFSICILVTFVVVPELNLYGTFAVPLGRIYTNTLMDTLLTRETLKEDLVTTHVWGAASGSINWSPADSSESQLTSAAQSASVQIQVQRTVQEKRELSSMVHKEDKTVPLGSPV